MNNNEKSINMHRIEYIANYTVNNKKKLKVWKEGDDNNMIRV